MSPFDNKDKPSSVTFVKMKIGPLPTDFIGEYYTYSMMRSRVLIIVRNYRDIFIVFHEEI